MINIFVYSSVLHIHRHVVHFKQEDWVFFYFFLRSLISLSKNTKEWWIVSLVCANSVVCAQWTTTKMVGRSSIGLAQQGTAGNYTESSCVASCGELPTCYSCDYKTSSEICWFGSTQNPPTAASAGVNHYDFVKSCSGKLWLLNLIHLAASPKICSFVMYSIFGWMMVICVDWGIIRIIRILGCLSIWQDA